MQEAEERVLGVLRALAHELGGPRAAHAVRAGASLEREVGLGSLERVELIRRLELAFARKLDDGCLRLDTAAELARALVDAPRERAPDASRATRAALAPSRLHGRAAATVHGALWEHAQAEPERPHVFLREDEGGERTITYGLLLGEAAALAGGLRARGIRRGDTVALMLPTGFDFLASFHGVLMCGAIPVPIYPPVRLDRLEEYAARQGAILKDAGVAALVTVDQARPIAAWLKPRVPSLAHVVSAADLRQAGTALSAPEGEGSDAAFIQYTSGSTGQPKGVLLTHANLLANIQAIAAGLERRPTDVAASWLPLYHDMGLIGAWLFSLEGGVPFVLQSPTSFLARPETWLWAIHRHRGTLSPAPNFAYELCVKRIPEEALAGLDLSSWRCALNGAEPVSPDTIERFVRRFEPYGFRREAMYPVYGLAENSVAVCFPPPGRAPRILAVDREAFERQRRVEPVPGSPLRFVSVGRPLPRHEVKVLGEEGEELPDDRVGRLAFKGPSMTPGYFRQPQATAAMTVAGGFYDSGDLAFRHDGEVFIAGRRKDLIIKGGRNLVPQEIEEVASEVPGVRKGSVVAFGQASAETATESLVVVAETREKDAGRREAIMGAVTERVAGALGVPPDQVVLVPPGAVPKTSSGKIRRAATRDAFREGTLGRPLAATLGLRLRLGRAVAAAALGGIGRRLPEWLFTAWVGLAVLVVGPLAWVLALLVPAGPATLALSRALSRLLLRVAGCRVKVEGLENLAAAGPCLLASNHTSYADIPILLAALPRDVRFVAKEEALGYPLVGTLTRKGGHLTVDRFAVERSVADAAKLPQALQQGQTVLVFPEGTFTGAAGLRPFRLGAFKAAVETGTRVVPVALQGSRALFRDGRFTLRPTRVQVWVGAPLTPAGDDWQGLVGLREQVSAAIAEHCGEPRLDLVTGGPQRV